MLKILIQIKFQITIMYNKTNRENNKFNKMAFKQIKDIRISLIHKILIPNNKTNKIISKNSDKIYIKTNRENSKFNKMAFKQIKDIRISLINKILIPNNKTNKIIFKNSDKYLISK